MKTEETSILNVLGKSTDYDVALLSTYTFDPEFFEQSIMRILIHNRIRRISVFVDMKMLTKALSSVTPFCLGKRYSVNSVIMNGAFHPKMILLLGKKRAKLIVGSANLTGSGYLMNREVFNCFEYDENDNNHYGVIQSGIEVFKSFFEMSGSEDKITFSLMNSYKYKGIVNNVVSLISNLNQPVIDAIKTTVPLNNVKHINIAVPFYDESLAAIQEIKHSFNCDQLDLYIQQAKSTFPVEYNQENSIITKDQIHLFQSISDDKISHYYHGKVIEFITDTNSYILYGSANCTSSALLRTYRSNGNVECCILAKGTVDDNKRFFESFSEENYQALYSTTFPNDTSNHRVFELLSTVVTQENIHIKIKCIQEVVSPSVFYLNEQLESELIQNCINVTISKELLGPDNTVFQIEIVYGSERETVTCWYNDINELEQFRTSGLIACDFSDLTPDIEDERYNKIAADIIRMYLENDEFCNFVKKQKIYKPISQVEEASDVNETEEIEILDDLEEISYEDRIQYRHALRAQYTISRFFIDGISTSKIWKTNARSSGNNGVDSAEHEIKPRKATSAEKKLARLLKRLIKETFLLNIDEFSFDFYKDRYGFFNHIIKRLVEEKKVTDFLDKDYIYDMDLSFLEILLKKLISFKTIEENLEWIKLEIIKIIILRGSIHLGKIDNRDKKLLIELNRKCNFRDDIPSLIKDLQLDNLAADNIFRINPVLYLESLFDFKSKKQLEEYFERIFGEEVEIRIGNGVFELEVIMPEGKIAPLMLADNYITEVLKYSLEYKCNLKQLIFRFMDYENRLIVFEVIPNGSRAGKVTIYIVHTGRKQLCKLNGSTWKMAAF